MKKLFILACALLITASAYAGVITQEKWDKRSDNTHADKWEHAEITDNWLVKDTAKVVGQNIKRWGSDYTLTYKPKVKQLSYEVDDVSNGKEFKTLTETIQMTEVESLTFPDGSVYTPNEGSAVHVLVTLDKKQDHNSWSFEVASKDGKPLVFVKQPELLDWEIKRNAHRPSYMCGGYAVWDSDGARIFSIPRGWARDATGDWIWIPLSREGNVITKTVPQAWLDKAKYPVEVDVNLGFSSVGGTNAYGAATNDMNMAMNIGSIDGNITKMVWYTYAYTTNYDEVTFGVYRMDTMALICDDGGGELTQVGAGAVAWVERTPDSAPVAITEGIPFAIVMYSEAGYQKVYYDVFPTMTQIMNNPGTGTYIVGVCPADMSSDDSVYAGEKILSAYIIATATGGGGGEVSYGYVN